MKTRKLRLVHLGSAKTLTRDLIQGNYTEMGVFPSEKPVG